MVYQVEHNTYVYGSDLDIFKLRFSSNGEKSFTLKLIDSLV